MRSSKTPDHSVAPQRFAPLALLALSACATDMDQGRASNALTNPPEVFQNVRPPTEQQETALWWAGFSDPALTAIMTRALSDNLDIGQAAARRRQAQAILDQSTAGFWPSLSFSASQTERQSDGAPDQTNLNADLDARWTLDAFGAVRRDTGASRASLEAADYSLEFARINIAADVAQTYIDYRNQRVRLAIAEEALERQTENLQIATFRVQAGLVSSLDVEQARSQRASTAATIPTLVRSAASARFRLALLAGEAPNGLDGLLASSEPGPFTLPPEPAVGIPAEVLRRRPDIAAAERRYTAALARLGVAQAQLLPSLSLTGSIGSSATTLDGLGDAWVRTFSAGLVQPIFQGGRLRAVVSQRRAAAEETYLAYRATVLSALQDVENALVAQSAAEERMVALSEQYEAADATALLARSNYEAGLTDFRTVLEAERTLLSARDGLASVQAERATALIRLYLALGGGWSQPNLDHQRREQ
jgi:outer membrane protein, multidrug efflux system